MNCVGYTIETDDGYKFGYATDTGYVTPAMEKELVLENMVKSLGFSDAVVSVSSESENVNVFINSSELNYDTALSIYNMMKNETGLVAGNVIIMPVYAET